jgi:four helix bundle protein
MAEENRKARMLVRARIASGSANELDYHLLLPSDLQFLADAEYQKLARQLGELRRMLTSLILKVASERLAG